MTANALNYRAIFVPLYIYTILVGCFRLYQVFSKPKNEVYYKYSWPLWIKILAHILIMLGAYTCFTVRYFKSELVMYQTIYYWSTIIAFVRRYLLFVIIPFQKSY